MKYLTSASNYEKHPTTVIAGHDHQAVRGYKSICERIKSNMKKDRTIVCVDCYIGVDQEEVLNGLCEYLSFDRVIRSDRIFYDTDKIYELLKRNITDDRVYGIAYYGKWLDLVDPERLKLAKEEAAEAKGNILILGTAADYIANSDILVLADMTIWEIQMRYRHEHMPNFHADNAQEDTIRKFKRGYFIDWRIGNVHKQSLYDKFDFYLDTVKHNDPRMIDREAFEDGLTQLLQQPFRTVPFFDEGLWGGQWMKEVCDVEDKDRINYAWSYNLLFQENEVNITFNDVSVNIPGYTLMQRYPKQLIGEKGFARFGAEYPIRYDFLDTMEGGNLSLQVHPNQQYMIQNFAMPFTQDESYYYLDCAPNKNTYIYLGLSDTANREDMERDLRRATEGRLDFPAEKYANKLPAKKHDHFSIPAGTVHCSGADTMVLEISSSPCIFTFKLWDWGRIGLDGLPRPVHIDHGMKNIQWDKHTDWIKEKCAFDPVLIEEDAVHKEERTGLCELQYLECRRIWMTGKTVHHTNGETNALNLISGKEAIIESPDGQFTPYIIHFAESVCIPATIKSYTITPYGESEGEQVAVMKTFVRF